MKKKGAQGSTVGCRAHLGDDVAGGVGKSGGVGCGGVTIPATSKTRGIVGQHREENNTRAKRQILPFPPFPQKKKRQVEWWGAGGKKDPRELRIRKI